jgi:hypothetical protein
LLAALEMGEYSPMNRLGIPYSFNSKSTFYETNEPALRNLVLKPPRNPVNTDIWKKGIIGGVKV